MHPAAANPGSAGCQWRTAAKDSPVRDRSNVAAIAEIVSRFDVVAIQEVRRSAAGFLAMLQTLGPDWAFLVTDVTEGNSGNNERLAFVYDTRRLKPSGLACELVVPVPDSGDARLLDQFARTPYAVSFLRGTARFTLVTLHVIYGATAADRVPELTELARWLATWSARKDIWEPRRHPEPAVLADLRPLPALVRVRRAGGLRRPVVAD